MSVTGKVGVVGVGGVSDLAGQPHGARVSVKVAAQVSVGWWLWYGQLCGRQPSSRRHTLEMNSCLSCLVI